MVIREKTAYLEKTVPQDRRDQEDPKEFLEAVDHVDSPGLTGCLDVRGLLGRRVRAVRMEKWVHWGAKDIRETKAY